MENKLRIITIILFLVLITGCATSKVYTPPEFARKNFTNSIKNAMPTDLIKYPSKFLGKEIHLIGILREVKFTNDHLAVITLDQKYWDYIEDRSIQTEIIFLSSKGEGEFLLLFPVKNKKEFQKFIIESINREDLMFVYGIFDGIDNKKPILKFTNGSFVHEKYYSTKIFQYDIKRNKAGYVMTNDIGVPVTNNFKILKTAGPGEND